MSDKEGKVVRKLIKDATLYGIVTAPPLETMSSITTDYLLKARQIRGLEITFDCLPPSELYPNKLRSLHWSKRAEREKAERLGAYSLGRAKLSLVGDWQVPEVAIITYKFIVKDKRIRDLEGMLSACKPWVDGMVDAGVLMSDDCWHLSIGGASIEQGKENKTILIIEGI